MTQKERDRLAILKQVKKKRITQVGAAQELQISARHVARMLDQLNEFGDRSVIHGLKGQPSNRRIELATQQEAIRILSGEEYDGFGPTLAMEYLRDKHGVGASKETVRQWMIEGKLWRAKAAQLEKVHVWRPRRSRFGELVQWDTSDHDWLEGRGEQLYLIAMIDDATSRLLARFARHDSTAENMKLLWLYLEKNGLPGGFYTDKASLFRTAEKRRRDQPGVDQDAIEMPPTQIGRALRELGIAWIAAHSPQAKGRVERNFRTAQDRLVKGMRVAKVNTLEQANAYLEQEYLPWWNQTLTVPPALAADAHRILDPEQVNLAGILSHVETRQVANDYTIRLKGQRYQIERPQIVVGLRKADVRVEQRLDGSIAVRYQERYLTVHPCEHASTPAPISPQSTPARQQAKRGSDWSKNFDLKKAPPIWRAAQDSGHRRGETD